MCYVCKVRGSYLLIVESLLDYQFFFFFFQAEDGIRDYKVTGVQTCALPIFDYDTLDELMIRDGQRDGEGIWGRWNANGPGTARLFQELGIGRNFVDVSQAQPGEDRKSTRLNSSHLVISYAVFCLKKKNTLIYAERRGAIANHAAEGCSIIYSVVSVVSFVDANIAL